MTLQWAGGALPVYSKDGVKPPENHQALEHEMEQFAQFRVDQLEKEEERKKNLFSSNAVEMDKDLKEWKSLLRSMRETFAENRRLWKDQLENGNK